MGLHLSDLLLPGGDVLLQFFDLVVEHVFELFQLLRFLLKLVYLALISVDCLVPLLDDLCLLLDLSL